MDRKAPQTKLEDVTLIVEKYWGSNVGKLRNVRVLHSYDDKNIHIETGMFK